MAVWLQGEPVEWEASGRRHGIVNAKATESTRQTVDGADVDFGNAETVCSHQSRMHTGSWKSAVRQEDSGEARGRVYTTTRG